MINPILIGREVEGTERWSKLAENHRAKDLNSGNLVPEPIVLATLCHPSATPCFRHGTWSSEGKGINPQLRQGRAGTDLNTEWSVSLSSTYPGVLPQLCWVFQGLCPFPGTMTCALGLWEGCGNNRCGSVCDYWAATVVLYPMETTLWNILCLHNYSKGGERGKRK